MDNFHIFHHIFPTLVVCSPLFFSDFPPDLVGFQAQVAGGRQLRREGHLGALRAMGCCLGDPQGSAAHGRPRVLVKRNRSMMVEKVG